MARVAMARVAMARVAMARVAMARVAMESSKMTQTAFTRPTATVGEHLQDFMSETELKAPTLAKRLHVGRSRLQRLLEGARCDADMALRLARFFGTTPQYWMNLQALRDLSTAQVEAGETIQQKVVPFGTAA
jgi:addiction module HigA family antidote